MSLFIYFYFKKCIAVFVYFSKSFNLFICLFILIKYFILFKIGRTNNISMDNETKICLFMRRFSLIMHYYRTFSKYKQSNNKQKI